MIKKNFFSIDFYFKSNIIGIKPKVRLYFLKSYFSASFKFLIILYFSMTLDKLNI